MKITKETPSLLIAREQNYTIVIMGILFLSAGLYLLLRFFSFSISMFLLPSIFVILGLKLLLVSQFITIIADKTVRKLTIVKRGLLYKKNQTFIFDEIREISIEEYMNEKPNKLRLRGLNYAFVINLQDGQKYAISLDLTSLFSSSGVPMDESKGQTMNIISAKKIADFLKVSFINKQPQTFKSVVDIGYKSH